MPPKRSDEVYKDKHGTWWARHNGKRHTLNTAKSHFRLLDRLVDESQRTAELASEYPGDSEVIILRGVPGSGKTTWAREYIKDKHWIKRISRDQMREMFDFGDYSSWNEKFIRSVRDNLIRACIEQGLAVVIDDTNLNDRDIREIRAQAFRHGPPDPQWGFRTRVAVPVRIVDIRTPLEICIQRDAQRAQPIGEMRIRELYAKHLRILGEDEPMTDAMLDALFDYPHT